MNRLTSICRCGFQLIFASLACMAVSVAGHAAGQTSANFAMPRDAINSGIADMSSANFRLSSSVGDAVTSGATGSVSFQLASGFRAAVNVPPAVLNLLSVFSRKFHNGTPFDLTIDRTLPITGTITVEPRAIGAGHMVVFRFDSTITAEGAATALDAALNSAATVTLSRAGNDVIATLANVADNKRLKITLTGVNGSTTAEASLGFLVGDINNTRSVTAADISGVKARSGHATTTLNFKFDVNSTGAINADDISAVKARSGRVLP